jgi:hypothetical protein
MRPKELTLLFSIWGEIIMVCAGFAGGYFQCSRKLLRVQQAGQKLGHAARV